MYTFIFNGMSLSYDLSNPIVCANLIKHFGSEIQTIIDEKDKYLSYTDEQIIAQQNSEREINEIIIAQQMSDLEIRLLKGGL